MPADTDANQAEGPTKKRIRKGAKARIRSMGDLDRRTRAARDAEDLRERIAADLGGWGDLSAMSEELVTGAALLGAVIRDRATSFLKGEKVDLAELMSLTNAQRRLIADLGQERQPVNVTAYGARPGIVTFYSADAEGQTVPEHTCGGGNAKPDDLPRQTVFRIPHNGREPVQREWQPGDPFPTEIEFVTPEGGTRAPQAPPRDED